MSDFSSFHRNTSDRESQTPKIVSHEDWLLARKALLAREKELTHLRDAISAARRELPWEKVEKPYVFDTPTGKKTLADLFDGKSQLAVYHFMLTPGSDHICPGCSFLSDHTDAARQHFEHADLAFVAVSRAPLDHIERVKKRMGWRFRWVSSAGTTFNYDYGVSFTDDQISAGKAGYNYGTTSSKSPDLHGTSIFAKDDAGAVYHTYSCYARGNELIAGAFNWLDLTPKGRNEEGTMSWVRLHDEYEDKPEDSHDCCKSA
jgi:predicted dithiol-disulfide oxidoreductase (DUF899 family)